VDPGLNILLFVVIVVVPVGFVALLKWAAWQGRVSREYVVYEQMLREYWLYYARCDGRVSWEMALANSKELQKRVKLLEFARENNKSIVWQHGTVKRINYLSLNRYPEPWLPSNLLKDPHFYDRWIK